MGIPDIPSRFERPALGSERSVRIWSREKPVSADTASSWKATLSDIQDGATFTDAPRSAFVSFVRPESFRAIDLSYLYL